METCSKAKRNLLLDIHGALDDRDRTELEAHVSVCRDCRNEKERLLTLLGEIRKASKPPELSAAEADAMVLAVRRKLEAAPRGWRKRTLSGGLFPLIPVAAAACLLVLVSLFSYRTFIAERGIGGPVGLQERVTQQDLEVIRNLDLLRNMEAIQKLVHIVDENGEGSPVEDTDTDIQGMPQSLTGVPYA